MKFKGNKNLNQDNNQTGYQDATQFNNGFNQGPKVSKTKLKNVSNTSKGFTVFGILAAVVIGVLALNAITSATMRDTVEVVSLRSAVPQDGLIKEDNMVKMEMMAAEYKARGLSGDGSRRGIVLWDERAKINNTYASYYIRHDTPVYWDAIGSESYKQYAYLYSMDGELLKISMDAELFGEMLVPGDRVNVRAAYTETVYTLPSREEFELQMQTGLQTSTQVNRQILLFNNVAILDMLNGNGESIFDKYYDLLALPKDQQIEVINSEEFKESVHPTEILLNVTPEEADRYMSLQAQSPRYMMTLLPRTSSNAITEVLNELQVGFTRQD